jgi:hypothetical protein
VPLDAWMPSWDVRSNHQVDIQADREVVYTTVLQTDFGRNPILRGLMFLRAIPAVLLAPRQAWTQWRPASARRAQAPVHNLLNSAFTQLEAAPPSELVFGVTGRFWTPAGGLVQSDRETFRGTVPSGLARAVWGFNVQALAPGRSRLSTETRVICGDPATRRRFLFYWRVVSRGSGVIRWALLRQIKLAAEGAAA